jgi:O-antigen ligase
MLVYNRGRSLSSYFIASAVGLMVGVVAVGFSPALALGGLLGIMLLVGLANKPELWLLGFVFITGGLVDPEILPGLKLGPISLQFTDILLLYLLALVVIKVFILRSFKLVRTPLDIPLLCFLFAVVLSALISIADPSMNTNWVLRRLRPIMYYLAFFAVTNLIRERRQLTILILGLVIIALLSSIMMFVQILDPSLQLVKTHTAELVTAGREYEGIQRTFMQAERLIYAMLLFLICSFSFRARWLPRKLELGGIGILIVAMFLTFQRNYWLTLILMCALLCLLAPWRERSRILTWGIVFIVAATLVISLSGAEVNRYWIAAKQRFSLGMQTSMSGKDPSTEWRITEIRYAIQSIAKHPLLGIGLGNLYRPNVMGDETVFVPEFPDYGLRWYIHNVYVWVLTDAGLIGLIPFIWLFSAFLLRGFTRWRKIEDHKLRVVVLGSSLGILGQAISNLVAPNFIQSAVLIVFAIMLGVNEVIYRWELERGQLGRKFQA